MTEIIPQKVMKFKKNKKPVWWNNRVSKAKKHLNYCKKQYKMRNTIQNRRKVQNAEDQLETEKSKAQEMWGDELVNKMNIARKSKDFWDIYNKLTKKQTDKSVLPLMVEQGNPIFDEREKSKILEDTFFKGKHLDPKKFNKEFLDKIIKKYEEITSNMKKLRIKRTLNHNSIKN